MRAETRPRQRGETRTMKAVSTTADHYTGKNAEVMRARIKAHAPDILQSRQRRSFILRAFVSRASQRAGITETMGPTTGKHFVILDDYNQYV